MGLLLEQNAISKQRRVTWNRGLEMKRKKCELKNREPGIGGSTLSPDLEIGP